jgi:hypothetical protein
MQLLLMASVGLLVGCEESFGPTDTPTSLEPAAKPAPAAVYDYVFTGDIEGTLQNVSASPSDPFKQVGSDELSFNFPASSTGVVDTCDQKNPELVPSTNEWRGYAAAPWGGGIDLSRRKRSAFHLQITGSQTDTDGGSINLAVNDVAVDDTDPSGNPQIRFQNARALVSAFSYSETLGGGPDYDAQDRCVNFEITATRQP